AVGGGMPRLIFQSKSRAVSFHFAELDDLSVERSIEFAAERRNLAAVRIGTRPLRRRVGVGNIFRNDPHTASLGPEAGGRDSQRFDEVQKSLLSSAKRV